MKFEYLPALGTQGALLDSRGKIVKRPVLMLELKDKKGEILEIPAIVDSGADTTTVNIEIAKALGIKIQEAGSIIGIGKGKIQKWMGHLPFKIRQTSFELDIPAWYIDSENVNILLGQEVFFELFRIKFEKDHGVFELNPVTEQKKI